MDPQILRGGLRIGLFICGLALLTLPFQQPGSAEYVVTVLSAVIGGVFVIGIALVARYTNAPPPNDKAVRKGYNKRFTGRGH